MVDGSEGEAIDPPEEAERSQRAGLPSITTSLGFSTNKEEP